MAPFLIALAALSRGSLEEVDAYYSLSTKIGISGSVERSEDRLYLFTSGIAVRGFHQVGVDALDLAKVRSETKDDHFGKWTKAGGKLTIRWGGKTNPVALTARGANLEGSGLTWRPIKRVDGLSLGGLFAREDPKNDGAQLMLRENGTFVFRNAHRVNYVDLRPVAPNDGLGRYVLRNWTIYLKYDNGQTASMSFELPHAQSAKSAEFLAIANQHFYRWPGELKWPDAATIKTKEETIGGVVYSLPATWRRNDDAASGAALIQPESVDPGELCLLTFPRVESTTLDASGLHQAMWMPITAGLDRVSGADAETVGPFLRSWAVLNRPDGGRIWIALYTMPREGKAISAMFAANREELFFKHYPQVEQAMRKATPAKN